MNRLQKRNLRQYVGASNGEARLETQHGLSPTYFISPFRVFRAFRGKREHTSVRDDLVHLMDIDANGWFFGSVHVAAVKTKVSPINDS
jgi:hypothetical protein